MKLRITRFQVGLLVLSLGTGLMLLSFVLAYLQFVAPAVEIANDINAVDPLVPYVSFIRLLYIAVMFVISSTIMSKGITLLLGEEKPL